MLTEMQANSVDPDQEHCLSTPAMWNSIVSVPHHCLFIYFLSTVLDHKMFVLCWCFTTLRHFLCHFGRGHLT